MERNCRLLLILFCCFVANFFFALVLLYFNLVFDKTMTLIEFVQKLVLKLFAAKIISYIMNKCINLFDIKLRCSNTIRSVKFRRKSERVNSKGLGPHGNHLQYRYQHNQSKQRTG